MDIPKFNTLVEHTVLDGDKVKIDDLLNKVLVITGFSISTSKYKDKSSAFCVKVQFYYCDDDKKEKKVFFSGSSVIKEQLDEVKRKLESQNLPLLFEATVKKVGNYYSLV